MAYQNPGADKKDVPNQVNLAREARVPDLQLHAVAVQMIGVKEEPHWETFKGNEEARDGAPQLRRHLVEIKIVIEQMVRIYHAEFAEQGQHHSGSSEVPCR